MPISQEAYFEADFDAWAGNLDALRRIATQADDLINDARDRALADRREGYLDDFPGAAQDTEWLEARVEELRSNWSTNVVISEHDLALTRSGSIDEALEVLDPRATHKVTIVAPVRVHLSHSIRIDFTSRGCHLEVRGADPSWVRGAGTTLQAAIQKDVPRWSWLRSQVGTRLYYLFSLCALVLFLAPLRGARVRTGSEPIGWFSILLISPMVALFLAYGLAGLAKQILPGFEIVTAQYRGKGAHALWLAGSALFTILAGIIINVFF